MAGMGIRALELARALGRSGLRVTLLVGNDAAEAAAAAPDVPVARVEPENLAAAVGTHGADAAVVSGHLANWWFHQIPDVPVAVDLYDPFFIENLHYVSTLGEDTARHDHATFELALARGDYFLCASAEQRLFYAGALYARGRIGARNFPSDPQLAGLVGVVPFGVPEAPAAGDAAAGRRAAGLPPDGPVVLFGGIYDWYDPELLLEAWPGIARRHPGARLLFFENPNPATTPQGVYARARKRARAADPDGRSIIFAPWLPYASRADLYAAVDLIVSICPAGLETDLAFRTRLVDAAWGGVFAVTVGGGSLARSLEAAGAGIELERTASAVANGVSAVLGDRPRLEAGSVSARRFAAQQTWARVTAPLAAWCGEARVDAGRLPFPPARAGRSIWNRLRRK
jgi:hypothetical protein